VETTAGAASALEERYVGEIRGQFFVEAYQRGYRWGVSEVQQLLDDIADSRPRPYYLQPLVVKRIAEEQWELVDGQQRLTTLYLILEYIKRHITSAGARYTLEYRTRHGSQKYLKNPDKEQSGDNIDYFHIYAASECIRQWFEAQDDQAQAAIDFQTDLKKRVKVIWYEAPEETDSIDVFRRLNVGRILLTDAELVKAQLLTRSKGDSDARDRSIEVAAEWDVIERDLRSPERWAFVTGEALGDSDEQATHISLLLDTLADRYRESEPLTSGTFQTLRGIIESKTDKFWHEVGDLHSLVMGWYDELELYHKIGYLVAIAESFKEFRELVKLAHDRTRSDFMDLLHDRIRTRLDLSESELVGLSYDGAAAKCTEALLLMNVETIQQTKSVERYSFQLQASGKWSLEHIHARNAATLNTEDQWRSWLEAHREALEAMPHVDKHRISRLTDQIDAALARFGRQPGITQHTFQILEQELTEIFAPTPSNGSAQEDDIDSISNLALLDRDINSALSNSVFEVKRRYILKHDREGAAIPVCTRNVFLKYYTVEGTQQIHFWGAEDRKGYLKAMTSRLQSYLQQEESKD
jgi:hypothetical protein